MAPRTHDEKKKNRYELATPQMFRLGDIVEIQISFIAIPLKTQVFKMTTVLHSVALIDSTFTRVSQFTECILIINY